MALTQEVKRRHQQFRGVVCPYCLNDQIEGGPVEIDCGNAIQPVRCLSCGKRWRDIYVLDRIEELDE